jgi:hypothetical protein
MWTSINTDSLVGTSISLDAANNGLATATAVAAFDSYCSGRRIIAGPSASRAMSQ